MTAGYGMVPRGAFYAPPGLRPYGVGGQTDPIAALIGNALGAFQGTRTARQQEADRQDALQRQDRQESDEANWRDFTGSLDAYRAGLTTTPPAPTVTPGAPAPTMRGFGTPGTAVGPATPATSAPPAPAFTSPTGTNYYRDVGRALNTPSKYTFLHEPGAPIFAADETRGTVQDTGQREPAAPDKTSDQWELHINDDGSSSYLPKRPGAAAVPGPQVEAKITPKQRETAGNGMAAQSADQDMRAIENDPKQKNAVAEVARWVALPAIGRIIPGSAGMGLQDVLRQARSAGLSDTAMSYLKRMFDFSSLAGPARYGRRFGSEIALQQIWSDFGAGQLGIGPGGVAATQKNRMNAVRAFRTTAGEAAWKEAGAVPTDQPPAVQAGPPNTRTSYSPDNPFAPK